MADITNAINDFKTAANGEAVRDSFVATINLVNDDNIALGLQISDLEISGMELGFQTSEIDIRFTELEGGTTNV